MCTTDLLEHVVDQNLMGDQAARLVPTSWVQQGYMKLPTCGADGRLGGPYAATPQPCRYMLYRRHRLAQII